MRFVRREPCAELRLHVQQLWYFEGPDLAPARERVLPSGRMQLLVDLHQDAVRWWEGEAFERAHRIEGAAVGGVYERAFAIDTAGQRRVAGAVLQPGGAPVLLGAAADELAGSHTALDALWGADGAQLREQLLEASSASAVVDGLERALCARVRAARRVFFPDRRVLLAVRGLEQGMNVQAVAARVGLGPKRLRQLFAASVGVTPKRYARIARMQALLEVAADTDAPRWAELAAGCGYYDQAHLIQEFRSLTGLTPGAYRPRAPGDRNHVVLAP